ncbi:MAG: hypothetical protein LBF79_02140, partial [Dysgonamonadaceae bacterium]|nr:hypothetical protein [Dysgonamonadaceae bacterium]
MARKNFLPQKFNILLVWLMNFLDVVAGNIERFGIPMDAFEDLRAKITNFQMSHYKADRPNAGKTDRLDRREKAAIVSKAARGFINQFLRFNPAVTDDDRSDLGMTVPDTELSPASPIDTEPIGKIDFSVHQRHTLIVRDSSHLKRAKPDYARGFEIWRKFGDIPEKDDDFSYIGLSSADRIKIDYPLDMVGTTVSYRFRWINTRGIPGPWSEIVSAV